MKYIIIIITSFLTVSAFAQGAEKTAQFPQFGIFTGKVLPNGIDSADEIFPISGLRYSKPMGKSGSGFADFGMLMGNGDGVKWQGLFAGVSMHIPVETLIGHAGVGFDFTRYETTEVDTKNVGGGHFVGGIMSQIGGNILARFDMKLNTKPGTSLYFAFGLVMELDGDTGGAE